MGCHTANFDPSKPVPVPTKTATSSPSPTVRRTGLVGLVTQQLPLPTQRDGNAPVV